MERSDAEGAAANGTPRRIGHTLQRISGACGHCSGVGNETTAHGGRRAAGRGGCRGFRWRERTTPPRETRADRCPGCFTWREVGFLPSTTSTHGAGHLPPGQVTRLAQRTDIIVWAVQMMLDLHCPREKIRTLGDLKVIYDCWRTVPSTSPKLRRSSAERGCSNT